MPVGNADNAGFARLDREFYKLKDTGNADLFFKFSSQPTNELSSLGAYWSMPFFESKLIKVNKSQYVWVSPNGGEYRFNKQIEKASSSVENYVLSTRQDLDLKVNKDGTCIITNRKNASLKYEFKEGKLTGFCQGDGNDYYRIYYNKNSFPVRLYNITKRLPVIEFTYTGNLLKAMNFPEDKGTINLEYSKHKLSDKAGTLIDTEILSCIKYIDGKEERFSYESSKDRNRKILLSDNTSQEVSAVAINKLIEKNANHEGYIEWDANTGLIVKDSGGEYAIKNPLIDNRHPDSSQSQYNVERKRGLKTQESAISYKKPENEYAQIWAYSKRTAVKMFQDANTGEQTRTAYIATPGNLSMKVRRIEKRTMGEADWKLFVSKSYNDKGELIREVDGLGNLKEFVYDNNGQHWKTLKNGELNYMAYNDKPEDALRSMEENSDGSITRVVRTEDGIFEIQKSVGKEIKSKMTYNKGENSLDIGGLKIFIENN